MSASFDAEGRLRAESGEEVLDAAEPAGGGPGGSGGGRGSGRGSGAGHGGLGYGGLGFGGGGRLAGHRLVERFPRASRALGAVTLVVVSAALGGKAAHDADRHHAAAATRGAVLLRLLGGGGGVETDPIGAAPGEGVAVRLTFAIRDDGPASVDILDATLHDPGVVVLPSQNDANVAPTGRPVLTEVQPAAGAPLVAASGRAVLVTVRARIDCLDPALPARPGALSLTVRGADGKPGQVLLPDPQSIAVLAVPASAVTWAAAPASALASTSASTSASAPTGDYYALCGAAQTAVTPTVVYSHLVRGADATHRTFSYRVTVGIQGDSAQRLQAATATAAQPAVSGISTTTDLGGPVVLGPGAQKSVVVTVHATDCAAIARVMGLAAGDGPAGQTPLGVDSLFSGAALAVAPGDPRFPQVAVDVDPPTSSEFYSDFLTQLLAACPALG